MFGIPKKREEGRWRRKSRVSISPKEKISTHFFLNSFRLSQCPGKVVEPLEETTAQDTYKCWIPKLWYTETSEL